MNKLAKPQALVVTVSDSAWSGDRQDLSGPEARKELERLGCDVIEVVLVPDEVAKIEECLLKGCDAHGAELVVTTGGTGLAPRDVTPEATARVIEKEVPGLAQLMRSEGIKKTRKAALSRGLAGVRGKTLILNLPGSVKGVQESLAALEEVLPHALEVISGNTVRCGG